MLLYVLISLFQNLIRYLTFDIPFFSCYLSFCVIFWYRLDHYHYHFTILGSFCWIWPLQFVMNQFLLLLLSLPILLLLYTSTATTSILFQHAGLARIGPLWGWLVWRSLELHIRISKLRCDSFSYQISKICLSSYCTAVMDRATDTNIDDASCTNLMGHLQIQGCLL